jgi:hypothetical protein
MSFIFISVCTGEPFCRVPGSLWVGLSPALGVLMSLLTRPGGRSGLLLSELDRKLIQTLNDECLDEDDGKDDKNRRKIKAPEV